MFPPADGGKKVRTSVFLLVQGFQVAAQFLDGNRLGQDRMVVIEDKEAGGGKEIIGFGRFAVKFASDEGVDERQVMAARIFQPLFPFVVDRDPDYMDIEAFEVFRKLFLVQSVEQLLAERALGMPENK